MSIRNEESSAARALCGELGQWPFKFGCWSLGRCLKCRAPLPPSAGVSPVSPVSGEEEFSYFQSGSCLYSRAEVWSTFGPKLKTAFVNEVSLEPSHTQVFSVAASMLSGWVE